MKVNAILLILWTVLNICALISYSLGWFWPALILSIGALLIAILIMYLLLGAK